jgi:hypothetical protein
VGALVSMESRKRKAGKDSKHKTKVALAAKEATEHYQVEIEKSMRDSIIGMEEDVRKV